ncbi:MAG: hypothetical protein ABI867_20180 [Kofleriaceae bacterium]
MRSWLLIATLAIVGCDKKDTGAGIGTGTSSGSAAVAPVAATPGEIEVFVDDASVTKVTRDQIAKWPRLDSLLPEDDQRLGTWHVVTFVGPTKPIEVRRPSSTYPEMAPAVFPGEGGEPAFGMFDPVELAKHGKPGIRQDRITQIRIKLSRSGRGGDHQSTGDGDPMKLVLAIKTAGGDKTLTGEQILALPREQMPGNEDTKGWLVTKLLAAAGVTKFNRLVLLDAAGTSLIIERKDFDDKTTIPFIKLNRQGSLRFRMMKKQGEGWIPTGDLRALATIKVD